MGTATVNDENEIEIFRNQNIPIILKAVAKNKVINKDTNETVECDFLGWYDKENNLISKEVEYTLPKKPTSDTTYTAKFGLKSTLIYLADGTIIKNENPTISRLYRKRKYSKSRFWK